MTDVSEIVLKALLEHIHTARISHTPQVLDQYPKGFLISYSELSLRTHIPLNPRNVDGPLYEISQYCFLQNWPKLHSLVVRKKEGYPGPGYFRAVGTELNTDDEGEKYRKWAEWAEECIQRADAL